MGQDYRLMILQRRKMGRPMFYSHKNLSLSLDLITLFRPNGSSTLVPLLTYVPINLGSLPIHSLIPHIPSIFATNELFMPLVRAKSILSFTNFLTTPIPSS